MECNIMHVTNAIEKLKQRHELDREHARLKITKTSIASAAGTSVGAVSQYFQAKIDSYKIEAVVRQMLNKTE